MEKIIDNTNELTTLGTRDVVEQAVAQSLIICYNKGKELHSNYVLLIELRKIKFPFQISSINKMYLHLRTSLTWKIKNKVGIQNITLHCTAQIFISLQSQQGENIADFLQYENQREPPTLSDNGMRHSGQKSDILECVGAPTGSSTESRNVSVMIMKGPALVHMTTPPILTNMYLNILCLFFSTSLLKLLLDWMYVGIYILKEA